MKTYGEHGRRGSTQRTEQIWNENWQENHKKTGESHSLRVILVMVEELHLLIRSLDAKILTLNSSDFFVD